MSGPRILELSDRVTLVCGDGRDWPLPRDAAIITDPPYGMAWNTDSRRYTNGKRDIGKGRNWPRIVGDNAPFDPGPWLGFERVVLWGSNHYANKLPTGTSLVWIKKHVNLFGKFLSDAEIAWMKGGHGVYCHLLSFPPPVRAAEARSHCGETAHPTQKPIGLMEWCMDRARVPQDGLVADPYMGSGTTGIAAIRTGRRFVGIELDPDIFAVAADRLRLELAQLPLRFEEAR